MNTILVVDDERDICTILQFALEDEGYQVERAINGLEAMDILDKTRVELVITDYMMPMMNGEELAKKLRADPQFKVLPIILMSGAQADFGRNNPELFNEVLDKPFETDALISMVRQLLPVPGS